MGRGRAGPYTKRFIWDEECAGNARQNLTTAEVVSGLLSFDETIADGDGGGGAAGGSAQLGADRGDVA
jgi:hypothetical protein